MEKQIEKIDPSRTIELPVYNLEREKNISYVKSEMFLTELMDTVCKSLDDYARAYYKDSHQLTILKLIDDTKEMNPGVSEVEFVQDGDLNKSLPHFVSATEVLQSIILQLIN